MIITIVDANESIIKELYKAGFVNPSVFRHNEIYKDFKAMFDRLKSEGKKGAWNEAVFQASEKHKVSKDTVVVAIRRMSKFDT